MSVPKSYTTPGGTTLPLTNLKGKAYLMVAYRLQWFNEQEKNFEINTEFLEVNPEYTVAKATIVVKNDAGEVVRKASATKRETKVDFSDHTEKAETSAIGRALALLGYGTQFALSDLDEGSRIVDSPVVNVSASASVSANQTTTLTSPTPTERVTFRKPASSASPVVQEESEPVTEAPARSGWR